MTHLLNIDPPDHTRLRRLVTKAFTPAPRRRVSRPASRSLTDHLIDRFTEPTGRPTLIHDFAFPLPIYAICDLLGVPREDQDDFRDWAGMMIRHGGGPAGRGRPVGEEDAAATFAELIATAPRRGRTPATTSSMAFPPAPRRSPPTK
ncbi:hypothetical protein SFUMM280S_10800 [Streptomyces fumanus]